MELVNQVLVLKAADKDGAKRLMDQIEGHLDAGELGVVDTAMAWRSAHGRTHMKYLHDHSRLIGGVVGFLPLGLLGAGIGYFIGRAYSFHHHEITEMVRDITDHLEEGRAALVLRTDGVSADRLEAIIAEEHPEVVVTRTTFSPEMDEELAAAIESSAQEE